MVMTSTGGGSTASSAMGRPRRGQGWTPEPRLPWLAAQTEGGPPGKQGSPVGSGCSALAPAGREHRWLCSGLKATARAELFMSGNA